MEIRIGAGGWSYFWVPSRDKLSAYSRAFDYVEVNSTFYEIPKLEAVQSWRKRVPKSFEFSIRCHKSITHEHFLKPTTQALENFDKMIEICKILGSQYLHILSPAKMKLNYENMQVIRNFFSSVERRGVNLVWELRGLDELDQGIIRVMQDFNIIHCVDLSVKNPLIESDVLYTRLFGKGYHNLYQFTDKELKLIDDRIKDSGAKKALVVFHGARMYKDAGRMKIFYKTNNFPKVTKNVGLRSLEEVLREDAKFPTTKSRLMRRQGWKVIDLTDTERIHADYYLEKLPEKIYKTIEDITKELG